MPHSGGVQGQVGWDSGQLGLVDDIPAYCRRLDWVTFKGSFQAKLFYDFMIMDLKATESWTCQTDLLPPLFH